MEKAGGQSRHTRGQNKDDPPSFGLGWHYILSCVDGFAITTERQSSKCFTSENRRTSQTLNLEEHLNNTSLAAGPDLRQCVHMCPGRSSRVHHLSTPLRNRFNWLQSFMEGRHRKTKAKCYVLEGQGTLIKEILRFSLLWKWLTFLIMRPWGSLNSGQTLPEGEYRSIWEELYFQVPCAAVGQRTEVLSRHV